ncbi:MAG: anti-sigma factor [Verrucomicrobia bacterium]|nr:MAG: anti-sigma factor [Verrucomicrobiota bacterium]PYK70965.1 MAG: anti-sigma factor [Verrucomicrobiota bacterium]
MNCEEAIKLMDGYLDGELDPITSQTIEQHLRDCRNCEQAYDTHRALVRAIGSAVPYYKAPAELRERIQSSLREEIVERPTRNVVRDVRQVFRRNQPELRTSLWGTPWNWLGLAGLGLAAAIIFAAIITLNLVPRLQRPGADQFLATQLIASHVRSLMANHLTDVASSDQHTVKPWLDAKLDFAPPVVDLSSEGFPLVGGRLDYLDNRPVAALIYQRRKHFINLFVWPAGSDSAKTTKAMSHQGYHLLHWVKADFNYWAVSDVNANDLQTFKHLFEEQVAPH